MRINRDGVTTYYPFNERFNKAAGPLVGEIFQTEGKSPIGYIMARRSRPAPNDWKPNSMVSLISSEVNSSEEQRARFDLSDLGEYERVVFSCIAWGDYSTYVLTGEMGSGKTTTTNLIQTVLKRRRSELCGVCTSCDPIIISLDFNKGFRGKISTDLVRRFQTKLSDTLYLHLRRLFSVNKITDALLEEIADGKDDNYSAFGRFSQERDRDVSAWNAKSLRARADALFDYVEDKAESVEERVEMMMALVRLTKTRLRADSACLVFFFDNMDSILPEAQYEILVEILSYMSIAGAKALVVLRRSTFHRLQNQAAFSFGCIEHIGPDVTQVIKERVQHYVKHWDSIQKAKVLDKAHQAAVRQRLSYILEMADKPQSALREIGNLSGGSVRQGLMASERLVINGAVQFDVRPHFSDDLKRAVLFGSDRPGIAHDDEVVANILMNPISGDASLLNVRILQLLTALAGDLSKRNVLTLLIMLKHIGNWRNEEVRKSLNYLLNMRRPLLWVDGKVEYKSVAEMQNSDDFLYLTEAGHLYLRNLSRDLVYVQEAVASIEWPTRWMPSNIDYSVPAGRFRVLRSALRELMEQDLEETRRFKRWVDNGHVRFGAAFQLITNRILASVGMTSMRILRAAVERAPKGNANVELLNEIQDWLSLINVGLDHEREISGMYRPLDLLSRDYNNLLRVLPSPQTHQKRYY